MLLASEDGRMCIVYGRQKSPNLARKNGEILGTRFGLFFPCSRTPPHSLALLYTVLQQQYLKSQKNYANKYHPNVVVTVFHQVSFGARGQKICHLSLHAPTCLCFLCTVPCVPRPSSILRASVPSFREAISLSRKTSIMSSAGSYCLFGYVRRATLHE